LADFSCLGAPRTWRAGLFTPDPGLCQQIFSHRLFAREPQRASNFSSKLAPLRGRMSRKGDFPFCRSGASRRFSHPPSKRPSFPNFFLLCSIAVLTTSIFFFFFFFFSLCVEGSHIRLKGFAGTPVRCARFLTFGTDPIVNWRYSNRTREFDSRKVSSTPHLTVFPCPKTVLSVSPRPPRSPFCHVRALEAGIFPPQDETLPLGRPFPRSTCYPSRQRALSSLRENVKA